MKGTFRLTRAEFKKIFKRPSVFIMAVMLVITVFVSIYIYKPVNATNPAVDYNLETSIEYYDTFYNEAIANAEYGINQVFDSTDTLILYHQLNTDRYERLNMYYQDIKNSYEQLNSASFEEKTTKYNDFKEALNNFVKTFDYSFEDFPDYPHIQLTNDSEHYYSAISTIRTTLEKTATTDPDSTLNIIKVNDYFVKYDKEFNNAINYITPTLLGFAEDFKDNYYEFNKLIEKNSLLSAIESKTNDLLEDIKNYQNYYNLLINNEFPIVTINSNVEKELTDALDYTVRILSNVNSMSKLSDYTEILNNLRNTNIVNYLVDVSSNGSIQQVILDKSLINDLEKAQKKTGENKIAIKNDIESLKNDNGIKNIQFSITEYQLLSETYSKYVSDMIVNNIAKDFSNHEFIKLYGYEFNEYNEYRYNERIASNKYFLENNIYSNSFMNNFSFGQNSSYKTNAYDFMYFVLEICAIVITVFAMMLICNLITSETESGTMTLLLVRPYNRGKVLTAKLLTTIFFVITFMLFSVTISLVGGIAMYGINNTPILAVFNGSTAISMSPILLMALNVLSLLIDIIFFVILAMLIATVLKNYAGSITTCIIILITHYLLNVLFGNVFWYSFLPGVNLHLFKFFGNNFITNGTSSAIYSIFSTPIQSSMSILFSGVLIMSYQAIFLLLAYTVFRNRDY